MHRPSYLDSYNFNWETLEIVTGGLSSLDANKYLTYFKEDEDVHTFLEGYGYDLSDPIQNAELFGNFHEAIQFIKRYFLKEGSKDGLDFSVPNAFYTLTDVSQLFLMVTGSTDQEVSEEDSIWASIILKVMHTILHLDKDLRHRYFATIQTQIFDRFYKYLNREDGMLFLESDDKQTKIPLIEFETKSKKTRESTIIKLLHKRESVAEELFDRIGIRFITKNKSDCLRVIKFLHQNYVIMANNIKPSRSQNSLFDFDSFRVKHKELLKEAIKNEYTPEEFEEKIEQVIHDLNVETYKNNEHTSKEYKAIHFTCRQLIKYKNPFYKEFKELREFAKSDETSNESELSTRLLDMDISSIAKDIRFFYPYEVQITDQESHKINTEGQASHDEYKKSQVVTAMNRLFAGLIKFKEEAKTE